MLVYWEKLFSDSHQKILQSLTTLNQEKDIDNSQSKLKLVTSYVKGATMFIDELGFLGFGTRLKLLTERIAISAGKVYKAGNCNFEMRWFTTFYYIATAGKPVSISSIATELNFSHPAVIKITNALLEHGYVKSAQGEDKRRRVLTLTKKGEKLQKELKPIWDAFAVATRKLFEDAGIDMLAAMNKLEQALENEPLEDRVLKQYREMQNKLYNILRYNHDLKHYFYSLNKAWIDEFFVFTDEDNRALSNPEVEIINKGGEILFIEYKDEIIATGAITPEHDNIYVISKMAVKNDFKGRGVGSLLLNHLINTAMNRGGTEVVLMTHEKLTKAVQLYRKAGFELVSPNNYKFKLMERDGNNLLLHLPLRVKTQQEEQ